MKKYLVKIKSRSEYYLLNREGLYPFLNSEEEDIPNKDKVYVSFFNTRFGSRISITFLNDKQIKKVKKCLHIIKQMENHIESIIIETCDK